MVEDFRELTNTIFKFLMVGDEASLKLIAERRAEIKQIDAHFVPPGVARPEAANFIIHYPFLKWGDCQVRGPESSNKAFERLEFLHKRLGIPISIMDHEIDLALHKFLIRKTSADFKLLEERREEIEMITERVENEDEMRVMIRLSNGETTKGFFIKGEEEVGSALEMLHVLKHQGIKVQKPAWIGPINPHIAMRLQTLIS